MESSKFNCADYIEFKNLIAQVYTFEKGVFLGYV